MDPADPPGSSQLLLPCSVCFRTFKPESLVKHQKVCAKAFRKKRKIFDSAKQRIAGTDIPTVRPTKPSPSLNVNKPKLIQPPRSRWREQHLNLIKSLRAARGVTMESEPSPSNSRLFQALPQETGRCPYCERNFGVKAFDRHVEFCQEQRCRIPKMPTSLEAMERLEARTKYRAPPPRRSVRSTTRDKYSPTQSHPPQPSSPSSPPPSLGGSRSSLDSRNSEARKSVRPFALESRTKPVMNAVNNNKNVLNNLERAVAQNSFQRNNGERRSLRLPNRNVSPSNFGPSPLRNSFRGPSSKYNTVKPIVNSHNNRPSRPSVLQLFPPKPVSPSPGQRIDPEGLEAKSVSHCNTTAPVIATNDTRKKEEKVKGASVAERLRRKVTFKSDGPLSQSMILTRPDENRINMTQSLIVSATETTVHSRSVSLSFPRKMNARVGVVQSKPQHRSLAYSESFPNLRHMDEVGLTQSSVKRMGSVLVSSTDNLLMALHSSCSAGINEDYDPYLSAQKQMEELLHDFGTKNSSTTSSRKLSQDTSVPLFSVASLPAFENGKTVSTVKEPKISSAKLARTYVPQLDKAALLYGDVPLRRHENSTTQETMDNSRKSLSFEELENDLQDILSSMQITDPVMSSVPSTNSDYGSLPRTSREPHRKASASSLNSEDRKLPNKFCHACGSAYPSNVQARFCCECGAKRLYS